MMIHWRLSLIPIQYFKTISSLNLCLLWMMNVIILCYCMEEALPAHYLYPCTGTKLTLCKESCNVVDTVSDRCQSQFTLIKENISGALLDYLYNFNCSSPESYLIPGLPPDAEKCLQADDVCKFPVFDHTMHTLMYVLNKCHFSHAVGIHDDASCEYMLL